MTDRDDDAIPRSFEEWRHCIEHHCRIPLTSEFAEQRVAELEESGNEHTKRFIESYGRRHHEQVLNWFRQVIEDG